MWNKLFLLDEAWSRAIVLHFQTPCWIVGCCCCMCWPDILYAAYRCKVHRNLCFNLQINLQDYFLRIYWQLCGFVSDFNLLHCVGSVFASFKYKYRRSTYFRGQNIFCTEEDHGKFQICLSEFFCICQKKFKFNGSVYQLVPQTLICVCLVATIVGLVLMYFYDCTKLPNVQFPGII